MPKGLPEMHFHFVVVDCGKQLLAIETVVSGTLQRLFQQEMSH